jgi:hypothetical protein
MQNPQNVISSSPLLPRLDPAFRPCFELEGFKMTTEKQIEANRRNATLSTGPASAGGLGRAAKNAVKHGLTAAKIVLKDESAAEFEEFLQDFIHELKPEGNIEACLVERIAFCHWRLRRVPKYEASMIEEAKRSINEEFLSEISSNPLYVSNGPHKPEKPGDGAAYLQLFSYQGCNGSLASLTRHESSTERSAQRARTQLEELRARRRNNEVPAANARVADPLNTADKRSVTKDQEPNNVVELNSVEKSTPSGADPVARHRFRPA